MESLEAAESVADRAVPILSANVHRTIVDAAKRVDVLRHETTIFQGENDLATSGARSRTGDLGFMNPTL